MTHLRSLSVEEASHGNIWRKRVFLEATRAKAIRWGYTWHVRVVLGGSCNGNERPRQRIEKEMKSEKYWGERWRSCPCRNWIYSA